MHLLKCFPHDCLLWVLFVLLGAVLVDQYCNPLSEVTLESITEQIDDMGEKVKKMLRIKNPSHPSLRVTNSRCFSEIKKQRKLLFLLAFGLDFVCFVFFFTFTL